MWTCIDSTVERTAGARRGRTACGALVGPARGALVTLALAASAASPAATAPATPHAARALVERLAAAGRAQVPITRSFRDVLHDRDVAVRGRLVLEPPAFARLEFPDTGERITLRPDGGEWLQPKLEQLVRFDAARASVALRWWSLLSRGGAGVTERRDGERTWVVHADVAGGAADSARVECGPDGLPRRLTILEAGNAVTYALDHWRFSRAKGASDFVIEPPAGYEVFDMP